jgi:hypothetical protein
MTVRAPVINLWVVKNLKHHPKVREKLPHHLRLKTEARELLPKAMATLATRARPKVEFPKRIFSRNNHRHN